MKLFIYFYNFKWYSCLHLEHLVCKTVIVHNVNKLFLIKLHVLQALEGAQQ